MEGVLFFSTNQVEVSSCKYKFLALDLTYHPLTSKSFTLTCKNPNISAVSMETTLNVILIANATIFIVSRISL